MHDVHVGQPAVVVTLRTWDRLVPLAIAAAVVAGTGAAAATTTADLRRDRGFAVVSPRDGAEVEPGFVLTWAPGSQAAPGGYAVVVDKSLPAPGDPVESGPRALLLRGTSLRLSLGPASTGSPSARRFHTVQVVRLDAGGRRLGEDIALVHVRTRP